MIPTEAMKVSTEMKSSAARTGKCQTNDNTAALANTMQFNSSDTVTADQNTDTSQRAGGHGFVNTIFRLRLRRCDDMMNRPNPPAKKRRNTFKTSKIWCNELKL